MNEAGFLVHSGNGRGKTYFFKTLEEAQKELKKHSSFWRIERVIKTGKDTYLLMY